MKLTDSFSLFLYAFKLKRCELEKQDSIWKRSQLEPEKNFFFDHVQDFFTKNNNQDEKVLDESCCLRYELNRDKLSAIQKEKLLLINQLFSRTSHTETNNSDSSISFKVVTDNSIIGPGILLNPITGIGILSFGFSLTKDTGTLEQLIKLNYKSRVFGRQDSALFLIPRNQHPAAQEQEELIDKKLLSFHSNLVAKADGQYHYWNIETLTNILLQDIPSDNITIISPNRLQGFTFVQTERLLDEYELNLASFRLRRMYNYNYTSGMKFTQNTEETDQTFEQIHFGASIEGCVVIVNGDKESLPPFLTKYSIVIKNRYIWSYFLAYYQRLALIEMSVDLARLYEHGKPKLEKLLHVTSDLSKIELRTLFSQVSYFSQHNDFYNFCKNNLKLDEMYAEIKEKLSSISRIVQEEVEIEEKDKEKKREKKDRLLEVMIAALLIPEIIFEFLSMLEHVFEINFPLEEHRTFTYILFAFSSLLFLTLLPFAFRIYKEYYHIAKAYFKKEELSDDVGFKKFYIE